MGGKTEEERKILKDERLERKRLRQLAHDERKRINGERKGELKLTRAKHLVYARKDSDVSVLSS